MNNLPDDQFNDESNEKVGNDGKELPIMKHKNEIIEAVKNNQFVIIHGETGCGKTTQVPQFLYKDGPFNDRLIGVTQPRKIAALTMAKRVAFELGESVGKCVGYEVRFDKKCDPSTKIKYMTDGILLNEIMMDPRLNDYGVIMIDEAHERAVITDVLLGLLKRIATNRPDLKVIISSATISVDKFSEYFENVKVIEVKFRLYPVDIKFEDYCSDYITKTIDIVQQIHIREMESREQGNVEKGDVLVFLTGQEEINLCCDELEKIQGVVSVPLYGSMDLDSQKDAFEPVKPYELKVVVATNIAETSITIPGIKYVIDCGYVKQNRYNASRGMDVLEDVRISKAQAEQRKGRAGRTQPGICHRLYQKSTYNSFKEEAVPEIYRKNLTEICLKLRSFNVKPAEFKFLDAPKPEELARCDRNLIDLMLMDSEGKLTQVGDRVSKLPLDPILGKAIIASLSNKCTMDVICIVSMFSEKMEKIFIRPRNSIKMADAKKKQLFDPSGDHFTLLNVYKIWIKEKKSERWCKDNFINIRILRGVAKIIEQIVQILKRLGINIRDKLFEGNREDIKKCFISGYFKNICIKQPRDVYRRVYDEETFLIHGSSSLKDTRPKLILFHEAIKSTKSFATGVMQLDEGFIRTNLKKELEIIKFPKDIDEPVSF